MQYYSLPRLLFLRTGIEIMRHSVNGCFPIAIWADRRWVILFPWSGVPRVAPLVALAWIALLVGGCGRPTGETARVDGSVSIEGQPVEKGIISFSPRESGTVRPATAEIVDGRYQASNVPLGPVLVQIHATKETGKMLTDRAEGGQYPETINLVPAKYDAGIEVTISGDESHDFNLTGR